MDAKQLMRTIASAFAHSDLQPLLNVLHQDIVWKSASNNPIFSFHGEHKGLTGVREVLANVAKDYTFHALTVKEIVSSGDVVWGLFDAVLSYDPKGKGVVPQLVELEMAIRWRLKDGKIIEHSTFFDTAHLLIQQGRLRP